MVAPTTRSAAVAAARDARVAAVRRGAFTLAVFVLLTAGLTLGLDVWAYIVLQIALGAALAGADRVARSGRRREALRADHDVAGVFARLASHGWRTIDGVELHRGAVDHVAVGPGGVFAVQVTPHDGVDELALRRVRRHATALEQLAGRPVVPLVVLEGARGSAPVGLLQGVVVLPGRALAGHLRRRSRALDEREAAQLHDRLCALLERPAAAAG